MTTANKVFVGGLAAHTTNESLIAHFSQYGAVECTVMMDISTGRSRGFGFITFAQQEAADFVLTTAHNVDGKSVECKPCMSKDQAPPPANPRAFGAPAAGAGIGAVALQPVLGATTPGVWVPSAGSDALLAPAPSAPAIQVDGQELLRLLQGVTSIAGVPADAAQAVVTAAAGLLGVPASQPAATPGAGAVAVMGAAPGADHGVIGNKIFCGGLAPVTTNESLQAYFSQFFTCEAQVMMDRVTGKSRGFGFLTFATEEQATEVLKHPQHVIDGKTVELKLCAAQTHSGRGVGVAVAPAPAAPATAPATALGALSIIAPGAVSVIAPASAPGTLALNPQPTASPSAFPGRFAAGTSFQENRVFCGGLPQSCDDQKLFSFASQYGVVSECRVMMDSNTGRSRGFGYVTFAQAESVDIAIDSRGQNFIDGKPVEVKRCQPKAPASAAGGCSPGDSLAISGTADVLQELAAMDSGQREAMEQATELVQILTDPELGLQGFLRPMLRRLQDINALIRGVQPVGAIVAVRGTSRVGPYN